jgi:RimJ/RimL family protein N-acetyltransferase
MTETNLHRKLALLDTLSVRHAGFVLRSPAGSFARDLAELGTRPIHREGWSPFAKAWNIGPPREVSRGTLGYLESSRTDAAPDDWHAPLAIIERPSGNVLGMGGMFSEKYPETRTVETGSWLTLDAQGCGVGTLVRRMLLAVVFGGLGAEKAVTAARHDNYASLSVTRKIGYRETGTDIWEFHDSSAERLHFELTRTEWKSSPFYLEPEMIGVPEFREYLGLS